VFVFYKKQPVLCGNLVAAAPDFGAFSFTPVAEIRLKNDIGAVGMELSSDLNRSHLRNQLFSIDLYNNRLKGAFI
jgi:hypothetical protein